VVALILCASRKFVCEKRRSKERLTVGGTVNRQNIVGPQISRLRYNRGWSQAKLAVELTLKGLEVEREFVAQIENQSHCVKDKDLPFFAAALGVPLIELFPKLCPTQQIHQTMAVLLREKKPNHVFPVVTKPLQLIASNHGK
jgi:transcriptional regulator with XRE-family HTH domain